MRRGILITRALWSCALLLGGCGQADEPGSRQVNIVNGALDEGHPMVGTVSASTGSCTGTYIGGRGVLTAAHCVDPAAGPAAVTFTLDDAYYPVGKVVRHPQYIEGAIGIPGEDIGVLILAREVQGVEPPMLSTQSPRIGEPITLVGFGSVGAGSDDFGTKRKGETRIHWVGARNFYYLFGANTCNGDSGGPTFASRNGDEVLIGVHWGGWGRCGTSGSDTRVDVFAAWIASTVAAGVATPGASGCRAHDGDLTGCDADGACAYYLCSAQCWPKETPLTTACP